MGKLVRAGIFTDIHWGRHSNSEQHNTDCLDFIRWFCDQVKKDGQVDHIIFMGDWYENRSSVNVSTLNYSYKGAELLNQLGLPVYFIVGNHDLYYRTSRNMYSTINFHAFANFHVIDAPTIIDNVGHGRVLLCPYMFADEYKSLLKYRDIETWFGHFEFKGFEVTTYGFKLDVGPSHKDFIGPRHIFSGHFHRRQAVDNISYIGNTFPMDFGDAWDFDRGMVIYDHNDSKPLYINWPDSPKYIKITLTELLDNDPLLPEKAKVKCLVNYSVNYSESIALRALFMRKYGLRDFFLEESGDIAAAISDSSGIDESEENLATVEELLVQHLNSINIESIDSKKLIEIYQSL